MQKQRPKHLDLPKIRLPIPGIVSILHRISGAAMFLAIPFVICLFQGSLSSADQFEAYKAAVAHPLIKIMLIGLLWAFIHHACAGVRFLLLDMHKGTELHTARNTAKTVIGISLVLTVVVGGLLW
ncbi:succinate dehydrogenase, cytochrome b556 subunit [Chitinivorax sp. B]|uniref:succinate dehydrogenase, cytochrome b556 subunit n=1 Tax=Chitinivorax sp. B TaxID=2502235 RepID=UPI0010F47C9E|nr:succinate dehydrogenase, cytochrome b556 subunit [Chitinivorax sp. B]